MGELSHHLYKQFSKRDLADLLARTVETGNVPQIDLVDGVGESPGRPSLAKTLRREAELRTLLTQGTNEGLNYSLSELSSLTGLHSSTIKAKLDDKYFMARIPTTVRDYFRNLVERRTQHRLNGFIRGLLDVHIYVLWWIYRGQVPAYSSHALLWAGSGIDPDDTERRDAHEFNRLQLPPIQRILNTYDMPTPPTWASADRYDSFPHHNCTFLRWAVDQLAEGFTHSVYSVYDLRLLVSGTAFKDEWPTKPNIWRTEPLHRLSVHAPAHTVFEYLIGG